MTAQCLRAGGRILRALAVSVALCGAGTHAAASEAPRGEVRVGVLAFLGAEAAITEWTPVVARLQVVLPHLRFRLVELDHEGMRAAARGGELDFVITNPGHYVELEAELGASRVLTLDAGGGLSPDRAVGSAVVTRADDGRLGALEDLRGKRLAVVGREGFGGYQLVWRELAARGIDFPGGVAELKVVGLPMDKVLEAVARGEADAGIVRACLIESHPEWAAGFRVVGSRQETGFPCATSTRLYPDWAMATLRHTPRPLAKAVAIALLGMPAGSGMAWSVPADYQAVHELFRELHIGPYVELAPPTLMALAERYWPWVAALASLLALWILYTVRVEYLVHARTAELNASLAAREALEDRMRASQEQADHLARLSVLGELSGTLAHELNQPLAAIGNYAQSLVRRVDNRRLTDEAVREAAVEMAGQAERAAGILSRIRGFARKRPAQRERVAIEPLVREAVTLFRGMLASAPAVEVIDALPPGKSVEVDSLQIQQVLLNLLKNGYDAARALPAERRRLELRLLPAKGAIRVAVRDFGPGMVPGASDQLFQPFFTTKPDGLGLGLSICRSIAEAHGGRLDAELPDHGPGMVFILSLPDHD
ncbi:sensor histidine kinase [Thauera phenolivorans]|uniref:sensor histidine kinase n=1 Tax=Thauera phenolivorans TaxID=1792543 RepID=UPI0009F5B445|nr:PhnD/SsuA/transferrin family substrate-binding protein [Thauera phenolivorans]